MKEWKRKSKEDFSSGAVSLGLWKGGKFRFSVKRRGQELWRDLYLKPEELVDAINCLLKCVMEKDGVGQVRSIMRNWERKVGFTKLQDLPSPPSPNAYTYFVEMKENGEGDGRSLLKIGRSIKPDSRLTSLQTENPFPLELLGSVEGGEKEGQLHHFFGRYQERGEWFRLPERYVNLIKIFVD